MENIPLLEGPSIELDIEMVLIMYVYMPHFVPCINHLWYVCVGYFPCERSITEERRLFCFQVVYKSYR